MLGRTAGGLYWMFRYLERSENTARLIEAGFRIALTRPDSAGPEWASVIDTAGVRDAYLEQHDKFDGHSVVDFLLRDTANPNSVMSAIDAARNNARMVRTALTREVWEAVNECWITLKDALRRPVRDADLPGVLATIRRQSGLVRGALHGTMMRNEIFDFSRIGTFIERSDSTARILDVKYYVLLPSVSQIGSSLDNVQWETILRSVAAHGSFRMMHGGELNARSISEFLLLDGRMPRSLLFCFSKIAGNLAFLEQSHPTKLESLQTAQTIRAQMQSTTIDQIFEIGLHEFLSEFLRDNARLGQQIQNEFRFYE